MGTLFDGKIIGVLTIVPDGVNDDHIFPSFIEYCVIFDYQTPDRGNFGLSSQFRIIN